MFATQENASFAFSAMVLSPSIFFHLRQRPSSTAEFRRVKYQAYHSQGAADIAILNFAISSLFYDSLTVMD